MKTLSELAKQMPVLNEIQQKLYIGGDDSALNQSVISGVHVIKVKKSFDMKKIVVLFYLILFSIPIQLYAQDQIKNFIHKNNIRPKTYEKIATILDQNRISYQPTELWNVVSDTLTNSQSLLSYRISEEQISNKKMNEQRLATERILHETLCYLIDHNRSNCPKLSKVYESLKDLQEREMISFMDILQVFHKIIYTNRNRLTLS